MGELLKLQEKYDVEFYENPEDADYVIVNTCGFLSSSRAESENTVTYFDKLGKKIIVMGCYIPVANDNFFAGLKNLYAMIPFINYSNVEELITGKKSDTPKKLNLSLAGLKKAKETMQWPDKEEQLESYLETVEKKWGNFAYKKSSSVIPAQAGIWIKDKTTFEIGFKSSSEWQKKEQAFIWKGSETRAYFNAVYGYEFLKIAEGCDNNCSFCIIPTIRGKQTSRPIESILEEVKTMLQSWVKEIQILSQDTTRYGTDIYKKPMLFELLEKIDKLEWDFKIKVYYLYPDVVTLTHLKRLKNLKKFIPYFDIPLQHIAPNVLKRMGRFYDDKHIFSLLDFIRKEFPDSFIHTNFIVGFPWETEADFEMLLEFVKKYRFESISFFEYHDEPLAASSKLDGKVSHKVALARLEKLKKIVNRIYDEKIEERKERELTGFIMNMKEKKITVRWQMQAPEIDEYDIIPIKNIVHWNINIWESIVYKL